MSFSSCTVLKLSSGNDPVDGNAQPVTSPNVQLEEGVVYPPIPGYRRVRTRPSNRPGPTSSNYSNIPGAGQYYGSPQTAQTESSNTNQTYGQSYGDQHYGNQNVGQSYGGNYDGSSTHQSYGGQGTPQTYGSPDVGQSYGQTYGNQNQDGQPYSSQGQTYDQHYGDQHVKQTHANQHTGSYMADYGIGPPPITEQQTGNQPHQTQKASIDVSNQGYKRPGATEESAPIMTSNIKTVSGALLGLSPEAIASYRRKFNHMDLNKDGILTMREFMAVSRVFGYKLTAEEMSQIFGKRDLDDSGGITFDEFVTAMQERARKQKALQPLREKFRLFDVKSRGYLTAEDLQPKLERELGFETSKTESFVDLYDKNKDYIISLFEFVDFYAAYEKLKGEIEQAFREFDRNGDGFVDVYELNSQLAPKGFREEEVETLMKKYDKDCDNRLNYQEFAAFWNVPIF